MHFSVIQSKLKDFFNAFFKKQLKYHQNKWIETNNDSKETCSS